jgi:hypothetical protein
MSYLGRIAIAYDRWVNALLEGSPEETLSSRAWRMQVKHQPYWWWLASMINGIFFWQSNHCRGAYHQEVLRGNIPKELLIEKQE